MFGCLNFILVYLNCIHKILNFRLKKNKIKSIAIIRFRLDNVHVFFLTFFLIFLFGKIKDLASKKIEGSKLFVCVLLMNGAEQKNKNN